MSAKLNIGMSYDPKFVALWNNLKEVYGEEIFDLDGVGKQLDIAQFRREYFSNKSTVADVSIDGNANVTDNGVVAYSTEQSKPFEKLDSYFTLWEKACEVFGQSTANEMVKCSILGDIYINDFHGLGAGKPYCFNYSTYDIMVKGLSTVDKIKSIPPKYLYAFKSQVEQFVTIASNSTLGATGLADLLIVMSFYVEDILDTKKDAHFSFASEEDVWSYVKETLISMIYTLNQPMRGNQSPFTNISIYDDNFLSKLSDDYINPMTGAHVNIDVIKKLQILFIDTMNEELERTPITFPVTTACFSKGENDEILDPEFLDLIAHKNLKFGFINMYIGKSSTLSSCCRLRSDIVSDYFNSFGAGSTKIGSLGVCTVNYARLGFRYRNDSEAVYFKEVRRLVDLCFKVNYVKRLIVEERINQGKHPLYSQGFLNIQKQYLTVGVNGFNETIELMGYDPLSEEGINFGIRLLDTINEVNNALGQQYKVPVNVEQIPAENTSIKLAKKDSVLGFNKGEYDIYSNQFIPLTTNADMLDRIRLQGVYDMHFSGGSILHLNVDTPIEDSQFIVDLLNICCQMGVVYVAINYNLQMCKNGHMSVGKHSNCPICGKEITDNYTRVVGFLTNVKNWHKVRREQDYPNREFYSWNEGTKIGKA